MNRNTNQPLLPRILPGEKVKGYDHFPAFDLGGKKISIGYESLFSQIADSPLIVLEGYVGVDWKEIIQAFHSFLKTQNRTASFVDASSFLKTQPEIEDLIAPFLGGDDPIFGKKTSLTLSDFFDLTAVDAFFIDTTQTTILFGCGASLFNQPVNQPAFLVYFDLPKNEIQYRMRAGSITNLGFSQPSDPRLMYKQFYFVDWEVCNKEKKRILPKLDFLVDQQRNGDPSWISGADFREGFSRMSTSYFRVRPWFEPGVWGGNWMKGKIAGLPQDEPNYAWSFEMIVPENGLIFSSSGNLLEASFDWLMYHASDRVLGKAHSRFQDEFPIRFDFLDTFDGGNLSVQCHPRTDYAKANFGENFTQDETYYILDTKPGAEVYLGFQEDIDPAKFRCELEKSQESKIPLDIKKFVKTFPSEKHGLYLIPNGTIHCSGVDNMVLEISATPYIYTFKIYDWLRLDLDGEPRQLNVARAFENLDFSRKGEVVKKTLIAKPVVMESGKGWKKINLPTHPEHFYQVIRYEFDDEVEIETADQCHILMLVEGSEIELITSSEKPTVFHYAETFAVPAATGKYKLKNLGSDQAKVVVSFVKDSACNLHEDENLSESNAKNQSQIYPTDI